MNLMRNLRAARCRAALTVASAAFACGLLVIGALAAPSAAKAKGRVIVIGFDGVDARTASEMMDAGQLPNLARLRESGTFAPLLPSNPAESPVSWASLNCGQNPAKTGVPGFVRRKLANGTPYPDFGHLEIADVALGDLPDNPLPHWHPSLIAGVVFLVFMLVFCLLLRLKLPLGIPLSLVLAGVGYWAGLELAKYSPSKVRKHQNPLEAQPFWEHAAANGVECLVLDAAQTFDRKDVDGARVLAGLGVPDARGGVNSFFIYTGDEGEVQRAPEGRRTSSNGAVYRVDELDGLIKTSIQGPVNFWATDRLRRQIADIEEQLGGTIGFERSQALHARQTALKNELATASMARVEVPMTIRLQGDKAEVTIGGHSQTLAQGQWSDFFHMSFALNPLLHVKAITRVKLVHLTDPHFELYMDALEIDPEAPPFWQPISQPPEFAAELAKRVGLYETVGWACMNLPMKDQVVDAETFLEDIEFTQAWRERMTFDALARDDWRMLMTCFGEPDRVQHMMYQFSDPGHPLYDAEAAARRMTFFGEGIALSEAIPAIYRQVDRLVGRVMKEHLRPDDTLIICSDHGFQSFRRQVHLNNWLAEQGFLALKPGFGERETDFLAFVDWKKTQAYAIGLGMVYVNQQGREKDGTVEPARVREVMDKILTAWIASRDPDTREPFGEEARVVADIHAGPYIDREADMLLTFKPGYRVSWVTATGGLSVVTNENKEVVPGPTCVDNDKTWSGDHVTVDPRWVQGILFSNAKLAIPPEGADLRHVAPTVLALLGVPAPAEYDLKRLDVTPSRARAVGLPQPARDPRR